MSIEVAVILFIAGVFLVVKGGDLFVDAASWIAKASGIPSFIVGATIVSLATTLPEMIVSVLAALQGKTEMGDRQRGRFCYGQYRPDSGSGDAFYADRHPA